MPNAAFAQLPDRLEQSSVGLIPSGWQLAPLSEFIKLLSGGTPKRKVPEYWNGTIPWFSVRDAPSDGDIWVTDTVDKITELGSMNSVAKVMRAGTTIISARGTVGRLALTAVPMAMNQSCYGAEGRRGLGDYFVYFLLQDAVTDLRQRTHGSVFDTITRETFATLTRVRPQTELTGAFEGAVKPYMELIRSNCFESRSLTAIRDGLFPRLVSGEISVPVPEA
jgi:type I restriction enzyme S subunit